MESSEIGSEEFDFDAHRRRAVEAYQRVRSLYKAYADVIRAVLVETLRASSINVASIEVRAKAIDSFADKAATPAEEDPTRPKYSDPLKDITDLTGARVITFFPRTVEEIDGVIDDQFEVVEKTDKTDLLLREERLGYQSVHYLVRLRPNRLQLPEYSRYSDLMAEIQVRTILQHAWAEIEHDIQYKSVETIPLPVRRRFMALAGLLEIADREFQAIQNEDERIRQEARTSVEEGRLEHVEITGDALKAYLDKKLGPDGRMTKSSYEFNARLLRSYGFTNFQQIDECIRPYDDDSLSRRVAGGRLGQLGRFELMLLAGMGGPYITQHKFKDFEWWIKWQSRYLQKMQDLDIPIGSYVPEVGSQED